MISYLFKKLLTLPLGGLPIIAYILVGSSAFASEVVDYSDFIRQVFTVHPEIQQQKAKLDSAEANIASSKAARLPTISIGGSYSNEKSESGNARISLPIYTFGRVTKEIELSGERYRLEELGLLATQNEVVKTASQLYVNYVAESRRLAVFRQNFTELNLLLNRIQRRRGSGYDSDADVNSAKSRVLQTGAKAMNQEILLRAMLGELSVLYGNSISEVVPLPTGIFQLPKGIDVEAIAMNQSPRLLEAEQRINIAEREVIIERLNNRPNFEAFASDDLADLGSDSLDFGVTVQYDWDNLGRAVAAKVGSAEALKRAAVAARDSAKQDVNIRLVKAKTTIDAVEKQIREQDLIVESLTSTKTSFIRQYEAGRKSLMELLNIYNELAEAKSQKIRLETQLYQAQIDIYSLTGSIYLAALKKDLPSQLAIINQNKNGA